ncbi:MAG: GAF domain-containing sensor histidine kinase [Anaerolineae bacterium]
MTTEWGICLVRWALLAAVIALTLLKLNLNLSLTDLLPLLVAFGAFNLLVTILLSFRLYFSLLSILTLVADVVFVLILIFVSGGVESPFFFFPIFPILVATLRFGWQIGFFAAFVCALDMVFQAALNWDAGAVGAARTAQFLQPGSYVLLFFLSAAVGGALAPSASGSPSSSFMRVSTGDQMVPDRFKLVYEMASAMSATLNYQRVLETILDISRLGFDDLGLRMGESEGLVLLYDKDGRLSPASYRNLVATGDETRQIQGVAGIVGEAIASARAMIGESPATDSELKVFKSLQPAKSVICVPLRAGFETYGAVLFASVKRNVYNDEHAELLTIFCNQATIALQNANLYQSLREERDKIIIKEEEARHKLARDLHDGPTQDVAAIAMRLNFARLLIERDPGRARAELERLEDLAHRTVKEIRSMLFTLRPIILETEGLVAALNQYAENLQENDGLPIRVQAENYQDRLDSETQGVVFAILEEAINNARKHAQASIIQVRLRVERDLFVAQVTDDGCGFDVQAVESNYSSRGSLGMINLRERAELVGGTLNIESSPGRGTRITLLVPLQEEVA